MTTRRALLLTFTLFLAPVFAAENLPTAPPESVGLSRERLDRLTETMQAYVDKGQLSGAVVLVARHGKVAYFESFGQRDIEAKSPMTDDAIFRIASQTKALVSTGILMLQEEGKLLITDPVSKYLPEFATVKVAVAKQGGGYDIVDAARPMTIRQLLTHTSGLSYGHGPAADKWQAAGIQDWYFAHRDEPIRKTVARIAELPLDAQPGEKYLYGYSIDILGAIIEVASGQPLDVFLKTRIFDPLKMQDTFFYLPTGKSDRLAAVYSLRDGKINRAPTEGTMQSQGQYVEGPRKSFSGGAGLLSTATDYARFLQAVLNGGELDGARILSRKTVELMTTDHLEGKEVNPGVGFGLGFSVLKDLGKRGTHGSLGEYGWGGAYHSTYWVDPVEDMVVVYFTQLLPSGGLDDHGKLRALIYQAVTE